MDSTRYKSPPTGDLFCSSFGRGVKNKIQTNKTKTYQNIHYRLMSESNIYVLYRTVNQFIVKVEN